MTEEERLAAEEAAKGTGEGDKAGTEDKSKDEPKAYTTAEIKSMMAKEKASGRNALLKELGVEDFATYKEGLTAYKKHVEDQKTETQKATDAAATLAKEKAKSDGEVSQLKTQVAIMKASGRVDSVEDISVLVMARVNETTTIEQAIAAVKEKHPALFDASSADNKNKGTGSSPKNNKAGFEVAGLGARLAASHKPADAKKDPYFRG